MKTSRSCMKMSRCMEVVCKNEDTDKRNRIQPEKKELRRQCVCSPK